MIAGTLALGALVAGALAIFVPSLFTLGAQADARELRPGPERVVPRGEPTVLVLALDGVERALLYRMLRDGELPRMAELLGGDELRHAHLDETMLAPLPSSTLASWATIFSGTTPAVHGVAGNEYFVRERRMYAGPAPVSVVAPELVLQTYTDDYANRLLQVPTIYERLRERDPSFTAWVSLSQYFRGADRLLMAHRSVVADAFAAMIDPTDGDHLDIYASLDREVVETLTEALEAHSPPRMLTVYLTGTDNLAHGYVQGPEAAVQRYLREVVDEVIGRLIAALERRDALDDRYVIVVSDHGHTQVLHDAAHALSIEETGDPPAVVARAGYRLRPFEVDVGEDDDFDTVLCYGGALAYVYVADRSSCPTEGSVCDWARPARFTEDVVPLAQAFFDANANGTVPEMRSTLDMIIVRPREDALEVYTGGGHTVPIDRYLAEHPHPHYVELEPRLRNLAIGPEGDHAGDIILIARNGDEDDPANRYYFAGLYHSWHGSPSREDGEVALIVSRRDRTSTELAAQVRAITGASAEAHEIGTVIERLLYGRE
jgi:predicted AlkP superfamily pyrophosphatase or phosphodiesterase